MKNIFRVFVLFSALFLFIFYPLGIFAQMYDSSTEEIESFGSDINVNKDASVDVKETIVYNFGPNDRHGIYRDIPIDYKDNSGKTIRFDLSNIFVTDGNGVSVNFTNSRLGSKRELKIGDPDILLDGIHTYVISYKASRMVGFFDKFDEIYWNVTGNDWPVPIKHVESTVTLPGNFSKSEITVSCYRGIKGSTSECDSKDFNLNGENVASVKFTEDNLNSHEGLTVAVGFPKGLIIPPTSYEKISSSINDFFATGWWLFILPILIFIWRYKKWSKNGRDPKGTGVIVAQYESPDGLSPMQIKYILSQSFGNSLVSEIVYLATKGYLKINKIKNEGVSFSSDDYELVMLKEADASLSDYQSYLLKSLFSVDSESLSELSDTVKDITDMQGKKGKGVISDSVINMVTKVFTTVTEKKVSHIEDLKNNTVKLSDLKYYFYRTAEKVQRQAEVSLVLGGYFPPVEKSKSSSIKIIGTGISSLAGNVVKIFLALWCLVFFGVFGAFIVNPILGSDAVIQFLISWAMTVIIWTFFSIIMPRMTEKGVLTRELVKGFKLYLSVAERDRINFHNAPENNPETFEKFLPYAMALGVEKQWAKIFEGIILNPLSWYNDPSMSSFNATVFASSMSSFMSSSASNLSSAPGSSSGSGGGGSSGGGGGGGGGGSW